MKRILKYISVIIILCGIGISLFYIRENKNEIVEKTPIRVLMVKSNSMYPIVKTGDFIIVAKKDRYNIDDIITYKNDNGYLITHRIIENIENEFITKGDNNNVQDEKKVKIEDIKGNTIIIINKRNQIIIGLSLLIIMCVVFFRLLKEE